MALKNSINVPGAPDGLKKFD